MRKLCSRPGFGPLISCRICSRVLPRVSGTYAYAKPMKTRSTAANGRKQKPASVLESDGNA